LKLSKVPWIACSREKSKRQKNRRYMRSATKRTQKREKWLNKTKKRAVAVKYDIHATMAYTQMLWVMKKTVPTVENEVGYGEILTINNYYDGPKEGIATYKSQPHHYLFLDEEAIDEDKWLELFELKPLDKATLELSMESWQIWIRWEEAFYGQKTTLDTHPALPEERQRYEEIDKILKTKLQMNGEAIKVYGSFEILKSKEENASWSTAHYRVKWTPIEEMKQGNHNP
jgi:hypothetical protein